MHLKYLTLYRKSHCVDSPYSKHQFLLSVKSSATHPESLQTLQRLQPRPVSPFSFEQPGGENVCFYFSSPSHSAGHLGFKLAFGSLPRALVLAGVTVLAPSAKASLL